MLVLSRHEAERIVVSVPHQDGTSTRIVVVLIECQGNKAKIGIDAPRPVIIYREELGDDFGK